MLDLEALVQAMQALSAQVVESGKRRSQARERAASLLAEASGLPGLRGAVEGLLTSQALPLADCPMHAVAAAPDAGDYTVLAVDGSQIAPDYHHLAPWFVVNAGGAVLRYTPPAGRERCLLGSYPTLLPPPEFAGALPEADPESGAADARAAAVALPGPLEFHRLRAELDLALHLLDTEADAGRSVLLLDGPLVQWRMLSSLQDRESRAELVRGFRALLARARELGVPVAGYISRSRATEWVTLLRLASCPEVAAGAVCDACRALARRRFENAPPDAHGAFLAVLRDLDLAAALLPRPAAGVRTQVLELAARSWRELGDESTAGFFYIHAGTEFARVEVPGWVLHDPALLGRTHAAVADQCSVGRGYPLVLSEAHEAAVVRGADREAFYLLIDRLLERDAPGMASPSAKALSKRRPLA